MGFIEETIGGLNQANVRYVVVGGVAVVLHGHVRLTVDLDLVVDLQPVEARRAVETLLAQGLTPSVPVDAREFANPEIRSRWIEEKGMLVFQMRDPRDDFRRVDLFVREPVPFPDLWDRSVMMRLETVPARVASIEDIVRMKRDAGRAQDLVDIEALEIIMEDRRGE